jgi:hypothetical protein
VRATVEVRLPLIDEPQICFVDEGARLQGMIAAFAAHQPMRQAMQFAVDELDETIEGCGVTALPAVQQSSHVGGIGGQSHSDGRETW